MRKIKVRNITFITPLQMDGPIITPLPVTDKVIKELVKRGYDVVEVIDGKDVQLTIQNYNNPIALLEKKVETVVAQVHTKEEPFVIDRTPAPAPEPEPVVEEMVDYDYGSDIEVVDTSLPKPESGAFISSADDIAPVSEEVESVSDVDISQQGEVSENKNYQNNGNRINSKRKRHK